ncbi:DNA mismatch repair protein Mlh1 [Hordeum vulgare]|nr:DNA mismatch repair protein Mlh1 [Hordeum vulgare]
MSPGAQPEAHRNPNGHHHAEGSSMRRTSGLKGEGIQDRRSQHQSEPVSSRRRREAGDEDDSVHEVPPPRRREKAKATESHDTLPISARISPRVPHSDNDARKRINLRTQSALLEEEGPIGPACFGPRIQGEPFPKSFTLPWDTPKYSGTAKLEDELIDYTTTVASPGATSA